MSAAIFDSRLCELGEGPLWHPERNQLFWFDILEKRLLTREGEAPLEWQFDEHASAAGWVDRDTLLIATESGFYRLDIETGRRELVQPLEADNAATRSNDGRADPWGGFWISTMSKTAAPQAGNIYRFFKGRLERLVSGLTIPNAICFAPDRSCAYYADSISKKIFRQPLDGEGWPKGDAEVFLDLSAEGLTPDGCVVDAEGALWNAQWGVGRVARYLADGRFDRAVEVPGLHSSCPAFGGADLSTLFVTTAREHMDTPDDAQGCVYSTRPGVRGLPEPRVELGKP